MKFCKDCKHFESVKEDKSAKFAFGPYCHAHNGPKEFDPVTGKELTTFRDPRMCRGDANQCGMDAKWFEPTGERDGKDS